MGRHLAHDDATEALPDASHWVEGDRFDEAEVFVGGAAERAPSAAIVDRDVLGKGPLVGRRARCRWPQRRPCRRTRGVRRGTWRKSSRVARCWRRRGPPRRRSSLVA